jgi:hypothetical protein
MNLLVNLISCHSEEKDVHNAKIPRLHFVLYLLRVLQELWCPYISL